ncbi:hypothetical protein ACH4C6_34690 [Streptomyces sp. NPDC017943]|uniref:hypothetical protein n=1 Tax=Streptomyces sp. NPDC017943 TaxID=3365019 RepID=UPI0037BD7D86
MFTTSPLCGEFGGDDGCPVLERQEGFLLVREHDQPQACGDRLGEFSIQEFSGFLSVAGAQNAAAVLKDRGFHLAG